MRAATLGIAAMTLTTGSPATGVWVANGQVLRPLTGITWGVILAADPGCLYGAGQSAGTHLLWGQWGTLG